MDTLPTAQLPPLNTLDTHTPFTLASRRSGSDTPKSPLSLDLSDLPPLITPSPPSNTLLITNLDDPIIFRPDNLQTIRDIINEHVPIHSWAPLKSFRRIVVSFWDTEAATLIRKKIDGEIIFDCRVRIYFGAETRLDLDADHHLPLPKSDKLFFISPPPSPPHGWAVKNEDPPNKEVHAEDLAEALAKLHASHRPAAYEPATPDGTMDMDSDAVAAANRVRSGSTTMIYHPQDHGDSPALPAIMLEDTTECEGEFDGSLMEDVKGGAAVPITHTTRPPVELMEH